VEELLERLDLAVAHKAAKLGARHPLALALGAAAPTVTTATVATAAVATPPAPALTTPQSATTTDPSANTATPPRLLNFAFKRSPSSWPLAPEPANVRTVAPLSETSITRMR
jgi:hypothetical protein